MNCEFSSSDSSSSSRAVSITSAISESSSKAALSVLAVLVLHFQLTYRLDESVLFASVPSSLSRTLLENGNYGVTTFFVISGFVITQTSIDRFGALNAIQPLSFYVFRFARIFPPLLLAMTLVGLLAGLSIASFVNSPGAPSLQLTMLSVFTFWHNLQMERYGYFNYAINIMWSLSVEEVFYLAYPAICVSVNRRGLVLVASSLIAVGPLYRFFHRNDELYFLYNYWACFDSIAIGCMSAILSRQQILNSSPRIGAWIHGAGWLLLTFTYCFVEISTYATFSITILSVGVAMILYTSRKTDGNASLFPFVQWAGRTSYELYLFHIILLGLLRGLVPSQLVGFYTKAPLLFAYLGATCLVAGIVRYSFSEPCKLLIRAAWNFR
jgi:peptidoglycan/LPS O-acetylase OafA/YrhL